MPEAPSTLEGWYCLHDFRSLDWPRWKALPESERAAVLDEARRFLEDAEAVTDAEEGASAAYCITGHKADLMFLHLRPTPDAIQEVERRFIATRLADFTRPIYSYFSVTELGLYEAQSRGVSENFMQVPFVQARLKPKTPDYRYMVFYPMDKRRGETENWYMLPMEERRAMMRNHGTIGHKYSGIVLQMITGSVGFDDWEWGVTLYTDDPIQFKKLVYEMRFDEVSARFAKFGPFIFGTRLRPDALAALLGLQAP